MNKQIEEMAKDFREAHTITFITHHYYRDIATRFFNLGYQKVGKDSVVLTKEELNEIQANFFVSGIEHGRNETASEIFNKLLKEVVKRKSCGNADVVIQELAKRFGVEIKE